MPPDSSSLLSDDIWPSITSAAKDSCCHVAVAYVGRNAPELLPLKKGSILVCDFSRSALERGLTNPDAIRAYLKAGVEVHSWENLHAKVFSFGDVAYVGSCNASYNSANVLTEAAVRVTDPKTVNDVSRFVLGLRGTRVGPQLLEKMAGYYCTPAWEKRGSMSSRVSTQVPLWVADVSEDASAEAEAQAQHDMASAKKMVSNPSAFELDWIEWTPDIPKAVRENEGEILMLHGHGPRQKAYAPARYLRSADTKGKKSKIIWIECPSNATPIPISKVLKNLDPVFGKLLTEIKSSHLVRNSEFAKQLRQLW